MKKDIDTLRSLEWLETNGLGGYASGTVSGAHSRRYHGLLVAAVNPPVGRMVVVSKLDETIVMKDNRFELGCNQYPGAVHPSGFQYLADFTRELFPQFVYKAGGVEIQKTIVVINGENTTVILYEVLNAPGPFMMELLPLYACRDFHSLAHANESMGRHYIFDKGVFQTLNYHGCPEIFVSVPGASFTENSCWYYNFEYAVEQYRGLDFQEDLFTHGKFSVPMEKGKKLGIILSTENPQKKDAFELYRKELARRQAVVKNFEWSDGLRRLALAADQFVVKRGDLNTIIAGYHWFSDWGRDTMIALPGLCLTTGRFEDAKKILLAFAESVSEGMLPNRFPDHGERPEYNTIDATLWFFYAIHKYYESTRDKEFIDTVIPVLEEIIEWHYKGTRYNIRVDQEDELLSGGQDGVQLTWMDARVADWVVTPRRGKAVEINALWYNALSILGLLLVERNRVDESEVYRTKARRVLDSFNNLFWSEADGYLYDFVEGQNRNADIRPNQLYAISLPFPLLTKDRGLRVLETVTKHLLTPRGLRSLEPAHKDYVKKYGGSVWSRDGGYHQGTVWSFLLGPYIDALIMVKGSQGKSAASRIMQNFLTHLDEGCVGSAAEIFDADPPHSPRGCVAQAWAVGEVLRVAMEYNLMRRPKTNKPAAAVTN